MAKQYSGGVNLGTGFKLNDPQPIADYMVVQNFADLNNGTVLPYQFTGMFTYVLETELMYVKKSAGWEPLVSGSIIQPTGLEAIDEGNGIGWRLIGRDAANYAPIGNGATDLSLASNIETDRGAAGSGSFTTGFNPLASGYNDIAMGNNNVASGGQSAAIGGYNNVASGNGSTVIGGYQSISTGDFSFAQGYNTKATNNYTIAMGNYSEASGFLSVAIGDNNTVTGNTSTAIGSYNRIFADNSYTFGSNNEISGDDVYAGFAIGTSNKALGNQTFAIGPYGNTASGNSSMAMGYFAKSNGEYAIALGNYVEANGNDSLATGNDTQANGNYSTAMGNYTQANGVRSMAINTNSQANGEASFAGGSSSIAIGDTSFAFGESVKASRYNSFASGYYSEANGLIATVFGNVNIASTAYETVVGSQAVIMTGVSADSSTVFYTGDTIFRVGIGTGFSGDYLRADGLRVYKSGLITAPSVTNGLISAGDAKSLITKEYFQANTGLVAVDDGNGVGWKLISENSNRLDLGQDAVDISVHKGVIGSTGAVGIASFVANSDTTASGNQSAAFGYGTNATGLQAFAFGVQNTASGDRSIAGGFLSNASAAFAIAIGNTCTANGSGGIAMGTSNTAGSSAVSMGTSNSATGGGSIAIGNNNDATGTSSAALGYFNRATAIGEAVLGHFAVLFSGNGSTIVSTDAAFRVGIGTGTGARNDGFRVFNNGIVTAPNSTISGITAGDNKSLITKEYFAANSGSTGGGGTWGSITGTLSAQTDLNTALLGKGNLSGGNTWGGNQIFSASTSGSVFTINNTTTGATGNIAVFQSLGSNVVTINKFGRITASSGTNSNEVVILSQLDRYIYLNDTSPTQVKSVWYGTQAQYDAISVPDPGVEYNIESPTEEYGTENVNPSLGTTIVIPHSLGVVPSYVNVSFDNNTSANLRDYSTTIDSSEIKIIFSNTPSETSLKIWWEVKA